MPANIETMFYNSENGVPWHGLGNSVEGTLDSEQALVQSGLMWGVEKRPLVTEDGLQTDHFATVRMTDNKVLGVVGARYEILQNREAFDWTDQLLGEGVRYETAGSLREGRRIWLLARLEESHFILGDEFIPYMVFSNSHDGTSAVNVAITPVRVVCQNTLSIALRETTRRWSARHTSSLNNDNTKIREAQNTLKLTGQYMSELEREAYRLADKRISLEEYVERLIPMPANSLPDSRPANNVNELREDIYARAAREDLRQYRGTAWQFIQAIADHTSHVKSQRETETHEERRFEALIDGHKVQRKAMQLVAS